MFNDNFISNANVRQSALTTKEYKTIYTNNVVFLNHINHIHSITFRISYVYE